MQKRIASMLCLAFLAGPVLAQTEQAAQPEVVAEPGAQVVVSGRRPGPGLWKVSRGEHVMWVFGTYSPLPQKMEWDDSRVERLIGQSNEVLAPPSVGISVGWNGLLALPSLIGLKKNPDGATLHDVLPAEVYARWSLLKQKYIGDDDGIERERPFFAAEGLLEAGLKKNGLQNDLAVRRQIEKIAKKKDVKVTSTGVFVKIADPRRTLKEFNKSQLEDVACFTKTMDSFEVDIDAMRARANAWAKGNIAEISKLDYAERDDACRDAMLGSGIARTDPALQGMSERARADWFKHAERALAANATTFAVLSMKEIMGPKSYLAELQAKGYTVEAPK